MLGIGASVGGLGSLLAPRLSLLVGGLAVVLTGWGLRTRPSPDVTAWRRGRWGSDAPPVSWLGWSGRGGRSCMTWRYPLAPILRAVSFEADQAAQVLPSARTRRLWRWRRRTSRFVSQPEAATQLIFQAVQATAPARP
jgi:hypothetical protein